MPRILFYGQIGKLVIVSSSTAVVRLTLRSTWNPICYGIWITAVNRLNVLVRRSVFDRVLFWTYGSRVIHYRPSILRYAKLDTTKLRKDLRLYVILVLFGPRKRNLGHISNNNGYKRWKFHEKFLNHTSVKTSKLSRNATESDRSFCRNISHYLTRISLVDSRAARLFARPIWMRTVRLKIYPKIWLN